LFFIDGFKSTALTLKPVGPEIRPNKKRPFL